MDLVHSHCSIPADYGLALAEMAWEEEEMKSMNWEKDKEKIKGKSPKEIAAICWEHMELAWSMDGEGEMSPEIMQSIIALYIEEHANNVMKK